MRQRSRDSHALVSALLFASVLTGASAQGLRSAAAQDDDHHSGHGFGIGLGISIGSGLIQGLASHPSSAPPPEPSPAKKKKASASDSGDSGKKSKSPPPQPSQSSSGATGVPPQGERRYVSDEIITSFAAGTSPQAINQVAQRYNLTQLETQNFPLIGTALYRWRLDGRRSLPDTIGALEQERAVASAQPNYIFTLQDDANTAAPTPGDPAQYVLAKMLVQEAHKLATGKSVAVAVIDSEADQTSKELAGSVAKTFDAVGGNDAVHPHGTAIAGAIASHSRLLGIAPDAQLYLARAFDGTDAAKGTSFAVYKSLEWSADNGVRLINMSFAGPGDPAMHRFLDAAYHKDIILVAAAGNAGPNSPPLYPASDSDVIAVTATDSNDIVFKMANRGDYIAIAAPGVDIMAAAPGGSYQFTSGTSIAAAHVSGTVALLLEKNPALKPKDVRTILANSATPPGPKDHPSEIGAGLCNAYQAVKALEGGNAGTDGSPGVAKR